MLNLTQTPGGVHHFTYEGPCGVSGAAQSVQFDLAVFLESLRKDPIFRDQMLIEVEAQDGDVTDAQFVSIEPAAPALPEVLNITISSNNANADIAVRVLFPHSATR